MEPQTTNESTMPPTPEPVKTKGSAGGLIAVLVILVLIVLGALYFWGERVSKEAVTPDAQLSGLESQSDSTEASDIQADLEAQTPDEFDANFDEAFGELDASFDAQ